MRESAGIIAFTVIENRLMLLMVKKRSTYGYAQFVLGRCHPYANIKELALQMTKEEFEQILYTEDPWELKCRFFNSKIEYDRKKAEKMTILATRMRQYPLENLIFRPSLWEFPKGKIENGEDSLDAAIREFYEETGIVRTNGLHLLEDCYVEDVYKDDKWYKVKYHLAFLEFPLQPIKPFSPEIEDVKWYSFDDFMKLNNNSRKQFTSAIRHVYKNCERNFSDIVLTY